VGEGEEANRKEYAGGDGKVRVTGEAKPAVV
jgi:hypothetical protein